MANFPAGIMKRHRSGSVYAWTLLGAGAALLVYLLLRPTAGGIPGWQPVNDALRATLDAHATAAAPTASNVPSGVTPVASATPASTDRAASATPASTDRPSVPPSSPDAHPAQLDLNSASEAELDGLPGIGPSKAKSIAAYRNAHQGFRSVDELLQVKGIGPKLLERIRPLVAVVSPAAPVP